MSTLPFVISVPHAGLWVPDEVAANCILSPKEIAEDGDGGAAEIYSIADEVGAFVTTDVARAVVDVNRPRDDRRADGVVKTHTCWDVPVYRRPLRQAEVERLLDAYYVPYHRRLSELGASGQWPLGIDCHTMAASGPPVGPDPGAERPWICLSNGDRTCPQEWIEGLAACFADLIGSPVGINDPFRGGYITSSHAAEMPWIQLELSRAPFMPNHDKRQMVLSALHTWTKNHL